ncbi:MAG TPA: carboxymuconolactone decarboxylase family protein [Candidatus Babeliales bacterium]|nr:carboxymuconolactone decarboxylase family protein [Candidatus Babeliales bacterium]
MSMTKKELENIDPALGLMGAFSKISQNTSGHIHKMREEAVFADGVISAKIKALIAALWGISARCEPCFKFYILKAKELGATENEVGEILAIASAMGGCVGEMWALKAYHAYKEGKGAGDSCCEVGEQK